MCNELFGTCNELFGIFKKLIYYLTGFIFAILMCLKSLLVASSIFYSSFFLLDRLLIVAPP